MIKKCISDEKKKLNENNLLNYIEPIIQNIIQDIINSRNNSNNPENIKMNYQTNSSTNKIFSFNQNSSFIPHIYEISILILFKRKVISFYVEHWKMIIDTTNSQFTELNDYFKMRLKKKFLTFSRTIKTLSGALPLISILNNISDVSFEVHLFKETKLQIEINEDLISEKNQMTLEVKEEKYMNIKLTVDYLSNSGIFQQEDNIKSNFDYNAFFTTLCKDNNVNENNKQVIQNNDDENRNFENNLSALIIDFEKKQEKPELIISNIIDENDNNKNNDNKNERSIIFNSGIYSSLIDKNKIDVDELYKKYIKNKKKLKCDLTIDDLLNKENLMNNEMKKFLSVKNKYNSHLNDNKFLSNEIYKELKDDDNDDLMFNIPEINRNKKFNKIISVYFNEENKNSKNEDNSDSIKINNEENNENIVNDIISDYIQLKKILNLK